MNPSAKWRRHGRFEDRREDCRRLHRSAQPRARPRGRQRVRGEVRAAGPQHGGEADGERPGLHRPAAAGVHRVIAGADHGRDGVGRHLRHPAQRVRPALAGGRLPGRDPHPGTGQAPHGGGRQGRGTPQHRRGAVGVGPARELIVSTL